MNARTVNRLRGVTRLRGHGGFSQGFTLIELLAGMAILAIMVVFLARIFSDATTIWKLGNKRIESSTDGRAIVDYMVRELSGALVDDVVSLRLKSDTDTVFGAQSDRIYFATLDSKAEEGNNNRQAIQVSYRVTSVQETNIIGGLKITNVWRIMRSEVKNGTSSSYLCYKSPTWWSYQAVGQQAPTMDQGSFFLAEDVRALDFWVYNAQGKSIGNYYSPIDGPPAYIDVCVEILGKDDAIKAATLTGTNALAYADRAARRYVGRAYLNNRMGYALTK